MARKLSVVTDDTPPTPKKSPPRTISAAASLSQREFLIALRKHIASVVDVGVPAHALAPLATQLRQIDQEIRTLEERAAQEAEEGVPVEDEIFDASAI